MWGLFLIDVAEYTITQVTSIISTHVFDCFRMLPSYIHQDHSSRAVDKFFSSGVLTFTTHHKQLCVVAMCYILQIQN